MREGIPAITVHDEVIAPQKHQGRIEELMTQVFESPHARSDVLRPQLTCRLRKRLLKRNEYLGHELSAVISQAMPSQSSRRGDGFQKRARQSALATDGKKRRCLSLFLATAVQLS
jgi:hypothetical protein